MSDSSQLDNRVAAAFYGRFRDLREAQQAAIEPLLAGLNIVLTSGTGSGKTEAVMAPLVSKYWREAVLGDYLFLLYIAPTKALVNDLEKRLHPPLSALNLRVGVRHGDRDDLKSGPTPHVLITTPESLDVMLFRKDSALGLIQAVIVDEVHLLYNTQRGLQLSLLLQRLRRTLPHDLQCAALSATVGDLSHIRDFLLGAEASAELLAFSAARAIDAQIRHIENRHQFLSLVRKMTEGRPTKLLVFANSRRECERLAGILQDDEALRHSVFAHYSSLSPEMRLDTERKYAAMRTAICVATSTLELGIDIGDIDAVLLWGVPSGVDSFLQRIGRGNRRSNKTNVVCLVPDDSDSVSLDAIRFAALLDAATKGELPISEPYELFGAVGQQCLSIIVSDDGRFTRIADLCDLFQHRPYLQRGVVESILAELASNGLLQRHGYKNRYGADEDVHRLVDMKMIYGNFGVGSQTVDLFHGAKHLGEVPAINLLRIRGNVSVRFAGKNWRVKKVSREGIHLEAAKGRTEAIEFSYGGRGIASNPYITDRMWTFIHTDGAVQGQFSNALSETVGRFISSIRASFAASQLPFYRTAEGICYYTFGGYIVNRAIGLYSGKPGFKADDVLLRVPSPIDWSSVPENPADYEDFFHLLFEASAAQSIYQKQLPLELQEREYLQSWLKDTSIPSILARLRRADPVALFAPSELLCQQIPRT
ncbi:MAG: DEAD/DEAH box helicase [Candidatus Hydrogenedentes bacterium]|nr:DEAD/DEAH box helicase [Candidatus Hydrogenedentota bacterium]